MIRVRIHEGGRIWTESAEHNWSTVVDDRFLIAYLDIHDDIWKGAWRPNNIRCDLFDVVHYADAHDARMGLLTRYDKEYESV